MNVIGLLVGLLVLAVIMYAAKLLVDYMELPQPIRVIVLLILGLIGLLALLNLVGGLAMFGWGGPQVIVR